MPMSRDSAPEDSAAGRGLRSILARVSSLFSTSRTRPAQQASSQRKRGHLGRQRALRLSTLLAPRNRLKLAIGGGVIVASALIVSLAFRSPSPMPLENAIWLDRSWTFGDLESEQLRDLSESMVAHQIGTAYAYVSSLGLDNRWSGGAQGEGSFMDSRPAVADFVARFKSQNDNLRIYGWIEIWAHLGRADGYRLDDTDLQSNVAEFSRLLVSQLGFDGVLLDVKPVFTDSGDLVRLIRRVSTAVGSDAPVAVAVTADLTPQDRHLGNIDSIAPGTMWSPSFKQRVMVSADEIVLLMYQSYRQDPLDYANWVAYHVETYIKSLETATKVLVSIPNYASGSSAHNPAVETMENALAGVREGLRRLDEEERPLLSGVAIFSDDPLSQSEWDRFSNLWLPG